MPLVSRILFALSVVALIITAIHQFIQWRKYKKEVKDYRFVLTKLEAEEAKKARLAKEAEVIRRFNEMQRERSVEEEPEIVAVSDKL